MGTYRCSHHCDQRSNIGLRPVRQSCVVQGGSERRVTTSAPFTLHPLHDLVLTKAFTPRQHTILHRHRSIVTLPCHLVNSQSLPTRCEHPCWVAVAMNSEARESVRLAAFPVEPGSPPRSVVAECSGGYGGLPAVSGIQSRPSREPLSAPAGSGATQPHLSKAPPHSLGAPCRSGATGSC